MYVSIIVRSIGSLSGFRFMSFSMPWNSAHWPRMRWCRVRFHHHLHFPLFPPKVPRYPAVLQDMESPTALRTCSPLFRVARHSISLNVSLLLDASISNSSEYSVFSSLHYEKSLWKLSEWNLYAKRTSPRYNTQEETERSERSREKCIHALDDFSRWTKAASSLVSPLIMISSFIVWRLIHWYRGVVDIDVRSKERKEEIEKSDDILCRMTTREE